MKKISILFVFISSLFVANAQSVVISSTEINPASIQTVENNGTATAKFNFSDISGKAATANFDGESNITISVNLLYMELLNADINQISGSVLDYFSVSYDADTKVILFEQTRAIPGYFHGNVEFPMKVTQNSSRSEAFNGFYAVLNSNNPEVDANGNASIFTFTDRNSQTGPSEETSAETTEEEILLPGLTVFPNPAEELVNISLSDDKITKIELFDLLGKQVLVKSYNSLNKVELNVSKLATSVYVLKVSTDEHTRSVKLFKN